MKSAYDDLSKKIKEEIVDKRSGEMFMIYADSGPLFCSVPSRAFQCRQMVGYGLAQGLIKPEQGLFQKKKSHNNDFYLLQRRKGSGHVKLSSVG